MEKNDYSPNQDFCQQAQNWQTVSSEEEARNKLMDKGMSHTDKDVLDERMGQMYSCGDSYQMGTIQDNKIYVALTDDQHNQLVNKVPITAQGGVSGYFSDQATIEACKNKDGSLNNTTYNEMCQIAPFRPGGLSGDGDATYKPHIECFIINRDKLEEHYHTRDFNAAIAKCEANNQFGTGGGNQGYNPYISEMIEKGVLKHNANESFSDSVVSRSQHNNSNNLKNSIVSEENADKMYANAYMRTSDCIKNNTNHPSLEACKNGYEHNPNPIQLPTGNATEWKKGESSSDVQSSSSNSFSDKSQLDQNTSRSTTKYESCALKDLAAKDDIDKGHGEFINKNVGVDKGNNMDGKNSLKV